MRAEETARGGPGSAHGTELAQRAEPASGVTRRGPAQVVGEPGGRDAAGLTGHRSVGTRRRGARRLTAA